MAVSAATIRESAQQSRSWHCQAATAIVKSFLVLFQIGMKRARTEMRSERQPRWRLIAVLFDTNQHRIAAARYGRQRAKISIRAMTHETEQHTTCSRSHLRFRLAKECRTCCL